MEAVTGIREPELSDLVIQILNYADRINEILNEFDNKFYELENYYQGKPYDDLKNYYNDYVRNQFHIVKNNIVSYSDDFAALIRKMHEGSDALVRLFNQFEADNKRKIKEINN